MTSTESNIGEWGGPGLALLYQNVCCFLPHTHTLCLVMVEGVGSEVPEDTFCEAVLFAHQEVK